MGSRLAETGSTPPGGQGSAPPGSAFLSPADFLGRMRHGWDLARLSLGLVRRRKRIVLLPIVGALAMVALLGGFLAGATLVTGGSLVAFVVTGVVFALFAFSVNLLLYFLLVLANAAIAVFALELFDGKRPTVFGSLRTTFHGGTPLFAWAAIAAAVSAGLRLGLEVTPDLRLELSLAGFVWTFFVPLVAPIVLFEGVGPFRAVRRSTSVRRNTWVEGLSGLASVYLMFFAIGGVGLIPPLVGALVGGILGLGIGGLIAVAYWVPLFFAGATTKAVLVAVVYRYGTTGEIPREFRMRHGAKDGVAPAEDTD